MNGDPAATPRFEQARSAFLAGLACQQAGDFAAAEQHYRLSLQHLPGRASTLVNLAATQLSLGRPAEALANAEAALAVEADSADALLHRGSALAQLGRPTEALASFERLTEQAPQQPLAWTHRGNLLRELGRSEEAATAFRQALHQGADPALLHFYLAAVGTEHAPPAPPRDYVERLFDAYAEDFDAHLLGRLAYRAHIELVERVRHSAAGRVFDHALDLGCGTGLCGPLLRPLARRLTGLDLSAAMLERSRRRGVYDELVQADAVAHLAACAPGFDLVLAADVLIYIGDPGPLLAALHSRMAPGLFALTVEALPEGSDTGPGWQLLPSLRYGHALQPLLAAAGVHGFAPVLVEAGPVRAEQGVAVEGLYLVLKHG